MRSRIFILLLLLVAAAGCQLVEVVTPTAPYQVQVVASPVVIVLTPTPLPPPTLGAPTLTPLPTSTPVPKPAGALNRHGLLPACVMPILIIAILWGAVETLVALYTRPIGFDLSEIRTKARDGLFVQATVSITVRKLLTPVSFSIRWEQLRGVAEKALEQELIAKALQYRSLEELEINLKGLSKQLTNLNIVDELARDYGVEVIRFNIELKYPQETMDALTRKAYAVVGGRAFLAYADQAGLDPQSAECRELYQSYLTTSGQVDAARNFGVNATQNLGDGLGHLLELIKQRQVEEGKGDEDTTSK